MIDTLIVFGVLIGSSFGGLWLSLVIYGLFQDHAYYKKHHCRHYDV